MNYLLTSIFIFVCICSLSLCNLYAQDSLYTIKAYEYSLLSNPSTKLKVQWNIPQLSEHKNSKLPKDSPILRNFLSINRQILQQSILLVTDYKEQAKVQKNIQNYPFEELDTTLQVLATLISQSLTTITEDSLIKKGGSVMDYEVVHKDSKLLSINQFYSPSSEDLATFFVSFSSYYIPTGEKLDISSMLDEKKTYHIIEAISSTVSDKSGNETTWQNYAEALRDIYTYCKSKTKNQSQLSAQFWKEVQLDCYFTPTHLVVWSPLENSTSILESDVLEVPLSLFSKALKPVYQKMFVK